MRRIKDVLNHVGMLLSLENCEMGTLSKITYLYKAYSNILNKDVNQEFLNSLNLSEKAIASDYRPFRGAAVPNDLLKSTLEKLKSNNPDSFLIIPIVSSLHLVGGLVRKTEDGFSLTIVNKEAFPSNEAKYMEFIFNNDNDLASILFKHHIKIDTPCSIDELLKDFIDNSNDNHILNVTSAKQKTGNCFVKEIEATIKYAFATRYFKDRDFISLHKEGITFHPKWNKTTDEIHKKYIEQIKKDFPEFSREIDRRYELYRIRKIKNKLIKYYPENLMYKFIQSKFNVTEIIKILIKLDNNIKSGITMFANNDWTMEKLASNLERLEKLMTNDKIDKTTPISFEKFIELCDIMEKYESLYKRFIKESGTETSMSNTQKVLILGSSEKFKYNKFLSPQEIEKRINELRDRKSILEYRRDEIENDKSFKSSCFGFEVRKNQKIKSNIEIRLDLINEQIKLLSEMGNLATNLGNLGFRITHLGQTQNEKTLDVGKLKQVL